MLNPEDILRYELLQTAVEAAGIGTWDLNPLTGQLLWSERCKELFGLPATAEVDYELFLQGLHPDDRARTDEVVRQALDPTGSGAYDIEYRTVGLQDQQLRWVRATGKAFFDAERTQAVRFVGTVSDITTAKTRELEAVRLAAIVEQSSDFVGLATADGKVLYLNPAAADLVGLAGEEQIRQTTIGEFFMPEALPAIQQQVLPAVMQQGTWTGELPMRRFDTGQSVPVRYHVFRLDDPVTGQVTLATASQDLTQHKKAEERFSFLAEMIPQLVWTTDPEGFHDYFNQRWIDYTGYTVADSQGTEMWNNLLHPDDRERARIRWTHSLQTGEFYEIEYRFLSKQGTYRWFLGQALPLRNAEGQIVKWFGTCTDIEHQKQLQERLEQAYADLELKVTFRTLELERQVQELRKQLDNA
ncbi:PAS domain-containing protein [Hymenobacter busanensis]|uniref:histidine kinase n=1 Tax=Hymenobacter busanensis TaxID=2607656 RepID=A0A7L4ZXC6_9BACT|nr:PAS domain-containing protein [Hymenobacter busanensis]KAA9332098.1 PAS domain-containing protein [Hymenobacter busanensis]QHJ07563.1 PAS domain-containing protein [Hymenobacter busanensis]